jgi:hypothetical protein
MGKAYLGTCAAHSRMRRRAMKRFGDPFWPEPLLSRVPRDMTRVVRADSERNFRVVCAEYFSLSGPAGSAEAKRLVKSMAAPLSMVNFLNGAPGESRGSPFAHRTALQFSRSQSRWLNISI